LLAKSAIFKHQKEKSHSLIPLTLQTRVPAPHKDHQRSYFYAAKPTNHQLAMLQSNEKLYYAENNTVYRYTNEKITHILLIDEKNIASFIENILIVAATCDILALDNVSLNAIDLKNKLPEHRLERIGHYNNINFYNDSKATTTASTLAAVEQLKKNPLHLFIGGLSKGVDRAPFIAQLKNQVKHIYCFGTEADALYAMCTKNAIPASRFNTLDGAFVACTIAITPGDCVLLSPAGSSYDLYENYEKRGNHFKELAKHYIRKHTPL
jgi:UDP-N-acetylmuramoylalanine-D-glutamate ligase